MRVWVALRFFRGMMVWFWWGLTVSGIRGVVMIWYLAVLVLKMVKFSGGMLWMVVLRMRMRCLKLVDSGCQVLA